jgi:hypothetical protein
MVTLFNFCLKTEHLQFIFVLPSELCHGRKIKSHKTQIHSHISDIRIGSNMGIWCGVSKGVEDGRRLPALWAGDPLKPQDAGHRRAWRGLAILKEVDGHPIPYAHG